MDGVARPETWLENPSRPPQRKSLDGMQHDRTEIDLRPAEVPREIELWQRDRLLPHGPRNLRDQQLTADESYPADEEPGLTRLSLVDGELDQRRRVYVNGRFPRTSSSARLKVFS